ncbi:DNA polymerase III subunit delta [Buchnera aphidicola]|uniref:DNA polymerase III subunit delta n=1 Tax=Buchnera aphidicola TaxID=9 RepID=UPI003463BB33
MNYYNLKKIIIDLKKITRSCYIIYGSEEFLIEKFQEIILENLKKKNIKNHKNINIDKEKNWNQFFYECKKKDFFYTKKIIILKIKLKKIQEKILKKIKKNKKILKLNIIIIILYKINYRNILNITFNKSFPKNKISISCFPLKKKNYFDWIKNYLLNNTISENAQKYLYKKFQKDFFLLNKHLDILSLTFPKKKITKKKIKKIIFEKDTKNVFQWINYLLLGKNKKSILSLSSLHQKNVSPLYLIRHLEIQINILVLLKKKKEKEKFLYKKKIWKSNHKDYIRSSKKNTYQNFLKIIKYLIWIKLSIKKINKESIWMILKEISIMFY